jgi:murein DD-endopeptidase MepM/ murein hydrolase activator NlpD
MIRQDYKSKFNARKDYVKSLAHHVKLRWGEIAAVAVGVILLSFALSSDDDATDPIKTVDEGSVELTPPDLKQAPAFSDSTLSQDPNSRIDLPLSWESTSPDEAVSEPLTALPKISDGRAQKEVEIKPGDTLSGIFQQQGFSARDVFQVTQDDTAEQYLRNIRPGKKLIFETDSEQGLTGLYYSLEVNKTLEIKKDAEGKYNVKVKERPIEIRQNFAAGVIKDSLFNAGKSAGLSDTLIVKLANIFGWDIDFVLDVRKNDQFSLIYEEKYLDGDFIGNGDIIAAQFINQGDVFRAIRYTDSDGNESYFTPEGKSMRKAFLRAPLNFMYISSNFKPRRFHPILKRWKAHRGIDYRAPTGTPVYAAGDGKVIASTYNKYNGKYVFIQHGNSIVTKYLHLSRRAVSYGKRVKQGQIIGYVGGTGLAEAPHLHYEFVVNGVHRNPRTVKLPEAKPIAKKEAERFQQQSKAILASLEAYQRVTASSGAH